MHRVTVRRYVSFVRGCKLGSWNVRSRVMGMAVFEALHVQTDRLLIRSPFLSIPLPSVAAGLCSWDHIRFYNTATTALQKDSMRLECTLSPVGVLRILFAMSHIHVWGEPVYAGEIVFKSEE